MLPSLMSVSRFFCLLPGIMLWAGVVVAQPAPPPAKPAATASRTRTVTAAEEAEERERILPVQIFLDDACFGPGVVDGRNGEFTRKAVAAWNIAHGHGDPDDWGPVTREAARTVRAPYAAYAIKPADLKQLTPGLPTGPAGMATQKWLGYRSLAEFVAERFHTTEAFLAKINPNLNLNSLRPGAVVRVPNVTPFEIEQLARYRSWAAEPALSRRSVLVNVRHKTAAFYNEKGDLCALFPITPGKERFIPYGDWTVQRMVSTPEFRWDKSLLEQGKRGADAHQLPPGPNSPVGIIWTGLDKPGIGMHGTATPETIGRAQSAGCIRLSNWDAARLPSLLRPGARVLVK